jgi:hypothetical protein
MASLLFLIKIIGRINCPEEYHGNFLSMPWKKGTGCSPRTVTSPPSCNSLQHKHPKHKSTPLTSIRLHISHWWPWKGLVLEPHLPLAQCKSYPLFPFWKFDWPHLSLILLHNGHCPPLLPITSASSWTSPSHPEYEGRTLPQYAGKKFTTLCNSPSMLHPPPPPPRKNSLGKRFHKNLKI